MCVCTHLVWSQTQQVEGRRGVGHEAGPLQWSGLYARETRTCSVTRVRTGCTEQRCTCIHVHVLYTKVMYMCIFIHAFFTVLLWMCALSFMDHYGIHVHVHICTVHNIILYNVYLHFVHAH